MSFSAYPRCARFLLETSPLSCRNAWSRLGQRRGAGVGVEVERWSRDCLSCASKYQLDVGQEAMTFPVLVRKPAMPWVHSRASRTRAWNPKRARMKGPKEPFHVVWSYPWNMEACWSLLVVLGNPSLPITSPLSRPLTSINLYLP